MLGQGQTTAEACRRIAVSEQSYYRWCKEDGGLKTDQAWRMKDFERGNLRLRCAILNLTLDKLILQEAARGNFLSPARRWRRIDQVKEVLDVANQHVANLHRIWRVQQPTFATGMYEKRGSLVPLSRNLALPRHGVFVRIAKV